MVFFTETDVAAFGSRRVWIDFLYCWEYPHYPHLSNILRLWQFTCVNIYIYNDIHRFKNLAVVKSISPVGTSATYII